VTVVDAARELERGREAFAAMAWGDALDALERSHRAAPLGADDLELLAVSGGGPRHRVAICTHSPGQGCCASACPPALRRRAVTVASSATKLPARIREHNLTLVAAGVAFYAFLALVPALIAFVSIYGLVANPEDVTQQVEDISESLPAEVQDFLVYQLTQIIEANRTGLSVVLAVSIALALWSASGGMAALITGIHIAREREEPKSFIVKRGKALLLMLGAIVFLAIVIFLIAALPPLLERAGLGDTGQLVFDIVRWPILAVLMILGIGLLYRFSVKVTPRAWLGVVTKGAVVAMIGWLIVSAGFAVYTANFASYGKTYGALASIVVVLLWLWLSCLAILVGAEIDGADEATA
jgi:membrane protein